MRGQNHVHDFLYVFLKIFWPRHWILSIAMAAALAKDGGTAASSGDAAPVGDGAGEQPLGKLSKAQIQKGDGVLDKIEKLLAEAGAEGAALPPKLKAQFQSHSAE